MHDELKSFSSNSQAGANDFNKFPSAADKARLDRYAMNDKLFWGDHFGAFSLRINDPKWSKEYYVLKYVAANFAGLISKVCADMLFSEPIRIDTDDGDQEYIEGLIEQNKLHTQFYESAIANSRHGDAVFKIRSGLLNPGDEVPSVIIEDISPSVYFPVLNPYNIRQEPNQIDLAWLMSRGSQQYLRKEIHTGNTITNELWLMDGSEVKKQVDLSLLGEAAPEPFQDTGIPQSLIVHVPNWRDGSRHFGYDDYSDLMSLFYAINNRMTKGENILDKHSDPILALPEGVLDEQGKVRKESFHMFEIPSDGVGTPVKPEYITWNASLEPAFKQIDQLVQFLYMFSETSPDAFGMGNGQSDSGRALRYKLMRTIAKVARKKLYYDAAIKQVLFVAQKFAEANGIPLQDGTTTLAKAPVMPEIIWQDGLPIDDREAIENEEMRLASGTQTVVDAIKNIDNVDEEAAQKKYAAIIAESAISVPTSAPKTDPANNDISNSSDAMVAAGVPATDNKGKQIKQVKLPSIDIARTQRLPAKGA